MRVAAPVSLRALLVGFSLVAFWMQVGPRAHELLAHHSRDARLTRAQALASPGSGWGAREDVLAWADRTLPRRARVYLDCPQPLACSNLLANWITYRLTPRVFTDHAAQADWVLFYDQPPGRAEGAPVELVAQLAPRFAIGRVIR